MLIVDDMQVGIVDLDGGEVNPVEAELASLFERAELALQHGATPRPVDSVPLLPSEPLAGGSVLVVDGPVALRLDGNRLLAWDPAQCSHVALDQHHLSVLDRARTGISLDAAVAELGDPAARAAADLARLGLLQAASVVLAVDEAAKEPEPDPEPLALPGSEPADAPEPLRPLLADLPSSLPMKGYVMGYRILGRAKRSVRRWRSSSATGGSR